MDTYSSQVFIEKKLILQNHLSGHTNPFTMKLLYVPQRREVNMSRAFREIVLHGLNINNSQIFYMDCDKKTFVYLGTFPSKQQIFLSYQYIIDQQIHIRYKKIITEQKPVNQTKKSEKKKVEKRTIKDVMNAVKLWRQLYDKVDQRGKRIYTLQSAALVVGIAKKTLDDYYSHIRLASTYGFNFQVHKQEKIGFLRQFVKNYNKNSETSQNTTSTFDIDQFFASSSDSQEDKLF